MGLLFNEAQEQIGANEYNLARDVLSWLMENLTPVGMIAVLALLGIIGAMFSFSRWRDRMYERIISRMDNEMAQVVRDRDY